jgi:hypothetical protein
MLTPRKNVTPVATRISFGAQVVAWCLALDSRVRRIVYTLGVCYLVYRLRGVLFLLLLGVIAAYILLRQHVPAELAGVARQRILQTLTSATLKLLTAMGSVFPF